MGDRYDTDKTTKKFLDTEKRINRDVSDWRVHKVRHSTTDDSLRRYKKKSNQGIQPTGNAQVQK